MASSKDYIDFILEQLSALDGITSRRMMGEYIIYYHGRIAAYICDNRLLFKPVRAALELMPDAPMEAPYEGAKDMLPVEDVDNAELLCRLFEVSFDELEEPKKKKKKNK